MFVLFNKYAWRKSLVSIENINICKRNANMTGKINIFVDLVFSLKLNSYIPLVTLFAITYQTA